MKVLGQQYDPFIPLVIGTQTASTNVFTGIAPFKELKHGQSIRYWLPYAGTSSGDTLTLTLSDGHITDAIQIYYKGTTKLTTHYGYGSLILLTYLEDIVVNGTTYTGWWCGQDYNSTYTNMSLGQGYGTCSTAAGTVAKVVSLSSYSLTKNGIVAVKFTYAVPANATMNINSKGAKNIFYRGAKITAGIIEAGDIAVFMYDGTQYQLISIDRWQKDIEGLDDRVIELEGHDHDSEYAPLSHSHLLSEITDAPFETVSDTLIWDGNTDGLYSVDLYGAGILMHYHVSDAVPTLDDFNNGAFGSVCANGVIMQVADVSAEERATGILLFGSQTQSAFSGYIVSESAVGTDVDGITFERAGVYVQCFNLDGISMYVSSLHIYEYTGFNSIVLKKGLSAFHVHAINDIESLQDELDSKVNVLDQRAYTIELQDTLDSGYKIVLKDMNGDGSASEVVLPTQIAGQALRATVLYDSSSGTYGTVTLTESAEDFTMLEIIAGYSDIYGAQSVKVYEPNGKTTDIVVGIGGNSQIQIGRTRCTISGTTITQSGNTQSTLKGTAWTNTTDKVHIKTVIGYR